jgi:hypothetical protein
VTLGLGFVRDTDIARGGSRGSHATTPDSRARGRHAMADFTINSTPTAIFRTPDIRNTLSRHLALTSSHHARLVTDQNGSSLQLILPPRFSF